MYSKQKTTTLTCDGVNILDETIGNELFLSTSIPNIYHKRSPIYRNINTYNFALYPGELQPSGHLDFSTIKDAFVTMELMYDGSQGPYDRFNNLIQSIGLEPIYFSKQVIIIAKSYNLIAFSNGTGKIVF